MMCGCVHPLIIQQLTVYFDYLNDIRLNEDRGRGQLPLVNFIGHNHYRIRNATIIFIEKICNSVIFIQNKAAK